MDPTLHPLEEHSLPEVLAQARRLAAGPSIDTSVLGQAPHLFELGGLDRLLVEGRDRVRFLHAMLSNDVSSLGPGEGRWATLNTVQGKTVSDVRIFILDDDKKTGVALALLEPGAGPRFQETLDTYIIADKVYFSDDSDHELVLVAGTGAAEALASAGASLPAEGLYSHVKTELGGAAIEVFRLDRTGSDGNDLAIRFAKADDAAVRGALSGFEAGSDALLEAVRIEAGQPRFGIDFTNENIPLEAGLKDLAISFTKGCYVGQEVICRIDSMGSPKRRLVQLDLEGDSAPAPGTLLLRDDRAVGYVTSSVMTGAGPQALGYVKKRHNDPGTELTLGTSSGPATRVGPPVGAP